MNIYRERRNSSPFYEKTKFNQYDSIQDVTIYNDAIEVSIGGCSCCYKDYNLPLSKEVINKIIRELEKQKNELKIFLNELSEEDKL